jgi:hypothetical protein
MPIRARSSGFQTLVGGPFLHPLLVFRVAGDPAGHVGHLPKRDLVLVWDALDVLVDSVV